MRNKNKPLLKWDLYQKMNVKTQILLIIFPIIVILDQWTKTQILIHFNLGETVNLIPSLFNFTYVQNKGAAFGMLATLDPSLREPFFKIVPVIAFLIITQWFRQLPKNSVLLSTALSLILSGAVGNFVDRLEHGFVVDFLDFHWFYTAHFPAFNIADSAICIGVGLILIENFTLRK